MSRKTYTAKRGTCLAVPLVLLAGILLVLPCIAYGQYTLNVYTQSTPPDLQIGQMKYWESNCTMYFWVTNKGGAAGTSKVWIDYSPVRKEVLTLPAMAANSSTWVQRSMWTKTATGQYYCSMSGVSKVRSVANARYLYKYSNSQFIVGDILPVGAYPPAGWYVGTQHKETNVGNNELFLYKSSIPTTTTKISTTVAFY